MYLTDPEQETVVNFNEVEGTASVYTHSPVLRRKLDKLSAERPEECRLYRLSHDGLAAEFYLPKAWIRVSPPRKIGAARLGAPLRARKSANM